MKKKKLLAGALLCTLNVGAVPIYSDYNFVGYTQEPQIISENYKYESVKLHKYYNTHETNIVYMPLDTELLTSPYVDESELIIGKYYLGDRSEFGTPRPIIYMKLDESYLTNTINIYNFNSYRNSIYEIEVFNKNEKINYELPPEYYFLNDGDIYNGMSIQSDGFPLLLDNYYDVKNIKVLVHFGTDWDYISAFTIEYVNEAGNSKTARIHLDKYYDWYKTKWLEFKVGDEYVNFLIDNNILPEEYAIDNILRVVYEYEYPLYKHYDLESIYYTYSFLDKIDGYTYDESEDITIYKVYAREYLGNSEDENITKTLDTCEGNNTQIEKPEIEVDNNPLIEQATTSDNFVYQVIPVNNNEDECGECVCVQKECDCNCETQNYRNNDSKRTIKYIVVSILSICLIIVIVKLVKLLCDKFTKKL